MVNSERARVPYPGLRPFEADEADLFFGRERHVDALLARLSSSHFVAVVGESGAGKSSLVRAGLLPALEAGFVVEAGSDWRVALMRPGGAPLSALADALLTPGVLSDAGGTPQREFALAELRRGPLGLVQLVRDAHLDEHCNTLIVVDQFEELFRYCREPIQKDQANIFVELLLNASEQREVSIFVVLTMRSDFVGDCARFRGLPEMLNDNQYLTPRLTRDQIAAAIREPARVCGGVVENALVDELCNAVGDDQDQLPLLQHLLMRVWDRARDESNPPRLTSELSRRMGGLRSALNDHAQQIYDSLTAERQAIARAVFKSLTDPRSQRRDLRRDALVSEVAAVAAVPVDAAVLVADEFRAEGRHMLMPPKAVPLDANSRLDISHESLLRQWSSLTEWGHEERINALEFDRLRDEAQREREGKGELLSGKDLARALDWIRQAEPTPAWAERYAPAGELDATLAFIRKSEAEAKRRKDEELRAVKRDADAKRLKNLVWLSGFAAVVAIAVVISVVTLWRQAEAERQRAEAGRIAAHASQLTANALLEMDNDPSLALLLSRAAVRARPGDDRAVGKLRDAIGAHVPSVSLPFTVAKSRNYLKDTDKRSWLDFSLSASSVSSKGDLAIVPSGNEAIVWSTVSGKPVGRPLGGHEGIVGAAVFSPDGALAVTTSADEKARVWDVSAGKLVAPPLEHEAMVNNAAFNRAGSLLVTLGDDAAQVWKVGEYGKPICTLKHGALGERQFLRASFSHNQKLMAAVTHYDSRHSTWQAQVWSVSDEGCREVTVRLLADMRNLQWASFSDVGPWLGLVTTQGEVTILNAASPRWSVQRKIVPAVPYAQQVDTRLIGPAGSDAGIERGNGTRQEHSPPPLAWSRDGKYFAFAGGDNVVRVAEVESEAPSVELRGHTGRVTSISFHPIDHVLLTTSADRTARVWRFGDGLRPLDPLVLKGHSETVGSGAFSRTGSDIITASEDGTVRLWKPLGTSREQSFSGIRAISYSDDGKQIWVSGDAYQKQPLSVWVTELDGSTFTRGRTQEFPVEEKSREHFRGQTIIQDRLESGMITVRDVRSLSKGQELPDGKGLSDILAMETSPAGPFVAVRQRPNGNTKSNTKIWDLKNPQARPEDRSLPDGTYGSCEAIGISNDKWLAWYCVEQDLVLVDDATRPQQPTAIRVMDETRVQAVRFSTSGRWLAVTLEDNSLEVFDSHTGKNHSTMRGHVGHITGVDFSKDDRFVATVSDDSTARVWDVTSGAKVAVLPAAGFELVGTAFSPDGRSVLLGSRDRLQLWRCYQCGDANALLEEVRRRNIDYRKLSLAEEARFDLTSDELNANGREESDRLRESQQAER